MPSERKGNFWRHFISESVVFYWSSCFTDSWLGEGQGVICRTFLLEVLKSVCCYHIDFGVALKRSNQKFLISDSFSLCWVTCILLSKFCFPFFIPSTLFWDLILLKPHLNLSQMFLMNINLLLFRTHKNIFLTYLFLVEENCFTVLISLLTIHQQVCIIYVSFPSLTSTNHFYVSFSYSPWSVCLLNIGVFFFLI